MELYEKCKEMLINHYGGKHQDRLEHSFGVVEMAEYLAGIYRQDIEKAKIAAILHDYCKYDDIEDVKKLLTEEEIFECEKYPFLYHAYGSAYFYKNNIGDDEDIFNAIYNHVFGRPSMSKLEAIIMISDYTEKNRKYAACIKAREMLLDGEFNQAIVYSLEQTMKHCLEQHENPHPRQLEVYNEYLEKAGIKF
ncbi:MAG: bis(5'-nucleosyl)-tetraphosphatase (symmetrical) YqeK [Acholeplasmatales bacterium]|nr:bis(5'-nucleosyl)-tetraphosphatase (symmetrical) YqeK [Acholeplasmatales bacterium]